MDIAQQGLQIHLTKDGRSRETRDRKCGKERRKGRKARYTGSGMKTKGLKVQELAIARLYKDTNTKI